MCVRVCYVADVSGCTFRVEVERTYQPVRDRQERGVGDTKTWARVHDTWHPLLIELNPPARSRATGACTSR